MALTSDSKQSMLISSTLPPPSSAGFDPEREAALVAYQQDHSLPLGDVHVHERGQESQHRVWAVVRGHMSLQEFLHCALPSDRHQESARRRKDQAMADTMFGLGLMYLVMLLCRPSS